MAKPSWLNVSPGSGSGNGVLSNSASAHTGRVARTGVVTVYGMGVSAPKTYNVTQSPKLEFVLFADGEEVAIGKNGGTLTISGKTNSKKLTFSLGAGNIVVSLPSEYEANGADIGNGSLITGDPGAVSEFEFSVKLIIPANSTTSNKNKILEVEADGGQSAQISIKQTAGDATLSVSPTSITINQAGNAVSVNVTSNTSWTVS